MSDPAVADLLTELVFKLSPPKDASIGSLKRALTNSSVKKKLFNESDMKAMEELADLADDLQPVLTKERKNSRFP